MFGRGKKTGEVGINKEADREIILWITQKVIETIKAKQYTNLKNEKLVNSETINNYTISAAYTIWRGVNISDICAKFITAYKKKIFSKSQELVLKYFNALNAILNSKDNPTSYQLDKFSNACRKITTNEITKSRALLNLSKGNDSKLRTAMNQQLTQMDDILKKTKATEKEIELDQTKFFELLNEKIGTLDTFSSWAILDGFGDDLNLIISYFETEYLSGEKLNITHPAYSCDSVTNDCLLRAYPVLKQLSETITKKKIKDTRFKNLKTFLKGAYDRLAEESASMYKPGSGVPENFDSDLGNVMLLLS